ncbi:MAG TPA: PilZ domain-containing protein [Terriglobales bacterium]|nr:PilZ domain-containing protein [Terriglobales bacterium]
MTTDPVPQPPIYAVPRRFPRYHLNVPLRVIAQRPDKLSIIEGRGNELNEGGMAVFAGVELGIGDQIAVEFTPPYSGSPIRVRCTVRNRQGYHYGVAFMLEDASDSRRVDEIRAVLKGLGKPA